MSALAALAPLPPHQVWEAALLDETAEPCCVRWADGRVQPLALERFLALSPADDAVLGRACGPVLDVGCGPGRIAEALTQRGELALGIDVSAAAVRLSVLRGAPTMRCDVFADVPAAGSWRTVLVLDGNVGIGGEPVTLLRRVAQLLHREGRAIVEVDAPGSDSATGQVRLELGVLVSDWFAWGALGADDTEGVAAAAGLRIEETFAAGGRWFVCLAHAGAPG